MYSHVKWSGMFCQSQWKVFYFTLYIFKTHFLIFYEKRWGLLFLRLMVIKPATKMMTLKTMMTVPWWRASSTRLGETILISNVQICIKHISKQFILQEYYLLDMMNDLILTTISVIFFMQYHIYFLDQMLPTIKFTGERKINTNNKQPLNKGCP